LGLPLGGVRPVAQWRTFPDFLYGCPTSHNIYRLWAVLFGREIVCATTRPDFNCGSISLGMNGFRNKYRTVKEVMLRSASESARSPSGPMPLSLRSSLVRVADSATCAAQPTTVR